MAGVAAAGADGVGRPVPRHAGRGVRRRSRPAMALRHPTWTHGRQDHDRLGDAGQQGPRGHRGALAVRCGATTASRSSSTRRASSTPPCGSWTARSRRSWAPRTCDSRSSTRSRIRPAGRRPRPRRTCWPPGRLDFRAARRARGSRPSGSPARPGGSGPRASAALIAADEVAVARFLDGTLDFPGIPRLLEAAVDALRDGSRAGAGRTMSSSRSTPRSGRRSRAGNRRRCGLRRRIHAGHPGGDHDPPVPGHPVRARPGPRARPLRGGAPVRRSASTSSGSGSRRGRKVLRATRRDRSTR